MKSRIAWFVFGALLAVGLLISPADASLIGYWSFDGGNADDGSGTGNHGAAGLSITYPSDVPFGNGLSARNYGGGGANVITVPTSTSLESIDGQLTVSFWMKASTGDNSKWARIFQHGNEANGSQSWLIDRYDANARTNMRVDTVTDNGPPVVTGKFNQNIATAAPDTFAVPPEDPTWHHLVYVLDNGEWRKYVNGVETSGTYQHGDGVSNTRPLYIFGRNGSGEYVGQLDDIGLWNSALDTGEAIGVFNLAMEPALGYGVGEAQMLFDVYDGLEAHAFIGDLRWDKVPDGTLTGSPGDVVELGRFSYGLVLNDAGGGVLSTVPEPSTITLCAVGLLGVAFVGWRRRRR